MSIWQPAPLVAGFGVILRVSAQAAARVLFSVSSSPTQTFYANFGLQWLGASPATQLTFPLSDGYAANFVGAPGYSDGVLVEMEQAADSNIVWHRWAGGTWTAPASVADFLDTTDPVVWAGSDTTHADSAIMAYGAGVGGGYARIYTVAWSGGVPSLSTLTSQLPGNYRNELNNGRPRLAGAPGNWWACGRSRYGRGGFGNTVWAAQMVSGGVTHAYGGPSSVENSEGLCLWVGSSSDVWVGGDLDLGTGIDTAGQRPWLWHWDGSVWSLVPLTGLFPANSPGQIWGVHGVSGSDLWAVGAITDTTVTPNLQRILIFHYNGSAWSAVTGLDTLVPPADQVEQVLYDVYARTSTDVWAVGTVGYRFGVSRSQLLALHYDGTAWSRVPLSY